MTTSESGAERLRNAYMHGAVPPLRDILEPTDADGAYAIQSLNMDFWQAEGRRMVGRKVGLTSKAVQTQLGVDQPDFGVLFDDMQVANGGRIDAARSFQPQAGAEGGFNLGSRLRQRSHSCLAPTCHLPVPPLPR